MGKPEKEIAQAKEQIENAQNWLKSLNKELEGVTTPQRQQEILDRKRIAALAIQEGQAFLRKFDL